MRPKGTAAELERRRRRAVQLVQQGEAPAVVARIMGVTRSSLHRWQRMARQERGLDRKPASGAKPGGSAPNRKQVGGLWDRGAPAPASPNHLGPAERVAQLTHRHFGVQYHKDHVLRLLRRRLGWTCHKPQKRARQRNDKEV